MFMNKCNDDTLNWEKKTHNILIDSFGNSNKIGFMKKNKKNNVKQFAESS